jgi:hypothetical protein
MAIKDKALWDQKGLGQHREITNSGGRLDSEMDETPRNAERAGEEASGPAKAGRKEGDDAWHNRANRSSEKSEGNVPMQGGNTAR